MKSGLVLLFSLLSVVASQEADNLDSIISSLFAATTDSPPTDNKNGNAGTPIKLKQTTTGDGSSSCQCVPYYLCNTTTTIQDKHDLDGIDRIVDYPCDYLSVCCNKADKLDDPITPLSNVNKSKGCGVRNPDGVGFRISGDNDKEAQFGEFPWMVAVLSEETVEVSPQKLLVYQCGASLIHPQVVLTSANCVAGKDKQYKIRAGEWDTQTKNELFLHQDRDVKTIIIHPEYKAGTLFYDFAVLILSSPLEIAENVDTVCLPEPNTVFENSRCYASGWGKDVSGKEGKYQVILKKIDLPVVPRPTCQDRLRTTCLGKHFELHKTFICAGGEEGKDIFKGDGGSPLVCPLPDHPGKYVQAGIVAWGIGCGENLIPRVYANVAEVRNWIDEQVAAHSFEKSYYTY